MVNKLLIAILLVLLAAPAWAFQVLRGSTVAGGGGSPQYTDDFSTDTVGTTWLEDYGSASISGGTLSIDGGGWGDNTIIYQNNLSSANGYMKFTISLGTNGTYPAAIFRYNTSSTAHYACFFWTNENSVTFTSSTSASDAPDTAGTAAYAVDTGDVWGITWTGTGTNVVVRLWKNPTADVPDSASSWDSSAADIEFADNPANTADTGLKVGFGGEQSSNGLIQYDNLKAGGL